MHYQYHSSGTIKVASLVNHAEVCHTNLLQLRGNELGTITLLVVQLYLVIRAHTIALLVGNDNEPSTEPDS
jgi:hypothetical protein